MKAIDFLKTNRFSVVTTFGDYYAQESDVEYFATKEEAEKFYQNSSIDERHMEACSWSKSGEHPTFSIELRELQAIPKKKLNDLEEDKEDMEDEITDIRHTYSVCLTTKAYIFNKEVRTEDWDTEEEKAAKEQLPRWILKEYKGSTYATLPFSEDVVSLIDGTVSTMKGAIE